MGGSFFEVGGLRRGRVGERDVLIVLSVAGTGSGLDGRTRGRPYARMRYKGWDGMLFLRLCLTFG